MSNGTSWQASATRTVELSTEQAEASIMREFNLPWPDGRNVGKGERVREAWRKAAKVEVLLANC